MAGGAGTESSAPPGRRIVMVVAGVGAGGEAGAAAAGIGSGAGRCWDAHWGWGRALLTNPLVGVRLGGGEIWAGWEMAAGWLDPKLRV